MDAMNYIPLFHEKLKLLEMDEKLMNRSLNEGFSGGEKKRNEILQLAVLEPKLAILDETDSGLDIDAPKPVAQTVEKPRRPRPPPAIGRPYYPNLPPRVRTARVRRPGGS